MTYYMAKTLDTGFDDGIARVEAALKKEGFGVLTRIDVRETMKAKLGAEFKPYVILGACNPKLAVEALQLEDKVGTMLPCNVVVQQPSPGTVEVAAIDPVASMQAIDNPRLKEAAQVVREKLSRVGAALHRLSQGFGNRRVHDQGCSCQGRPVNPALSSGTDGYELPCLPQ